MAGNAKRITAKLKKVQDAFVSLPLKHRTRAVFHAIVKVSGVNEKRADEHFKLGMSLLDAATGSDVLNG